MLRPAICSAVSFGFFTLAAMLHAAPPQLDYLFPAGAQKGQTTVVSASGAFSTWPVKTWVDREGLTVTPGDKKGELKITASPEASGVYWLRLYNEEGASALRPWMVGNLPEVSESETNDDPRKPHQLDGPCVVNGKLAKRGDVDAFALELQQGQTLVASLMANDTLGSPMDGVLQICDANGFVLTQNDDARGYDPLATLVVPRDGVYLVRTFAFPVEPNSSIAFAGGENFVYRLTITTGPIVDHAFPMAVRAEESTELRLFGWGLPDAGAGLVVPPGGELEVTNVSAPGVAGSLTLPVLQRELVVARDDASPESPQAVETPVTISGRIETPSDIDAFRFRASKGKKVSLRVESRVLGFPLDPMLEVTDAQGKSLAEVDDEGRSQRDPSLSFAPPADGEYVVTLRDVHRHGGLRYVYRLTLEEETPDFRLTVAADAFTLTPGKPLEIPITIERRFGFQDEIEITAEGLPSGVSAAAVKSLPKGDSAKSVKLIVTADAAASGNAFAILGRSGGDSPLKRAARMTNAPTLSTASPLWLTVTATK